MDLGPVRADGFTDEDKTQEAEELKSVPDPVLPSKEEVEAHNVSHLPFRSWCSACVSWPRIVAWSSQCRREDEGGRTDAHRLRGLHSLGSPRIERTIHFWCSSCGIARVRAPGVTLCLQKAWYTRHPARADLDFLGHKRIVLQSDQEPSVIALL